MNEALPPLGGRAFLLKGIVLFRLVRSAPRIQIATTDNSRASLAAE
jgi:hypothetical protein